MIGSLKGVVVGTKLRAVRFVACFYGFFTAKRAGYLNLFAQV